VKADIGVEIRRGWVDVEVAGVDRVVDGVLERFGRGLERRVNVRVVACADTRIDICVGFNARVGRIVGVLKTLMRQRWHHILPKV